MRERAQLLHRPPGRTPVDVVHHLVGLQAQAPMAAELGIWARSRRTTLDDVNRALVEDRSVIRTYAMRGTIHLVAAEDFGWLTELTLAPSLPTARRRLAEEGVPLRTAERAVGLIEDMLAEDGPLTRPEIGERLRRRRVRAEGQAVAWLTWLAAAKGVACFGPMRRGRPTFALVRDWVGPIRPVDRDRALGELAARYLATYGPALPEDLASWSGLRAGEVRRAWELVAGRLTEVETGGVTRWRLKGRRVEAAPDLVRLLPMFDAYVLAWRSRDLVLAERHRRRVIPGGGMIHQAVVTDGVIGGTWSATVRGERLQVSIQPFARPDPAIRRALAAEAEDLGRFRGLGGAKLQISSGSSRPGRRTTR
jgi:Winged helix DNA-binding domain